MVGTKMQIVTMANLLFFNHAMLKRSLDNLLLPSRAYTNEFLAILFIIHHQHKHDDYHAIAGTDH